VKRSLVTAVCMALALVALADPWDDEKRAFLPKYKTGDAAVRAAAVRALQQHRSEDGMDFLVTLYLAEPEKDVQAAFVDVISGVIDGEGRKRFYEHCRGGRQPEARAKLVAILGRGGYRDTMDALKSLLKDSEPMIRSSALDAMASAKFQSMEPVVRSALIDSEETVRIAASRALGSFRSEDSVSALIGVLENDKADDVKVAAGDALGLISGQAFGTDAKAWRSWQEGRKGLRISQVDVDRALDRAAQWLLKLHADGYAGTEEAMELELYALIHAGVPLDHKNITTAIAQTYRKPMTRTYNVALGAMALADISPSFHQKWIARAAEFLLNAQAENGQFGYGEEVAGETPSLAPPVGSGTKPEFGTGGTKALKRVPVRPNPRRKMAKYGDNSNTQYAVLGLRACVESGVEIPKETWIECLGFLKGFQAQDGGFGYNTMYPAVAGSIHTSALGAYIVCRYYGGYGTKRDTAIEKALSWLAENFAVDENPKRTSPREWHYYYFYGMERVGVMADTEFFGKHEWYQEGARYLLQQQTANGDWNNDSRDTAWAILFLRRATRPVGKVEDK